MVRGGRDSSGRDATGGVDTSTRRHVPWRRLWWPAFLCVVVAVASSVVTRSMFEIEVGTRQVLIVAVSTASVLAAAVLPARLLPSAALVLITVIPPGLFPDQLPRSVTPAAGVMVVWIVRRLVADRSAALRGWRESGVLVTIVLLAWCAVTTADSVDLRVSIGWTAGVVVAIAPAALLRCREEADPVRRTWSVLAVVLGLYVVAESFLESNPIFGSLPGVVDPQHWSQYRSAAGFGHPLAAGTFFAVSFALLVGNAVRQRGRRRVAAAVGAVICFDAVLSTISRGSIAAAVLAAGLIAVGFVVTGRRRITLRRPPRPAVTPARLIVASGVAALAATATWVTVVLMGDVISRSTSAGAGRSNAARVEGTAAAADGAVASRGLGVGPGASQRAVDQFNDTGVPIENSYLQLLLSIGIPGVAAFVVLLLTAAVVASRRRDWGGFGAVVALAASIGTYNFIDARPAYHLLVGLVLVMALQSRPGSSGSPTQSSPELPQREQVPAKSGPEDA